MFIAVAPYAVEKDDEVLRVFDTDDCSVETVSLDSLLHSDLYVKNVSIRGFPFKSYIIHSFNIFQNMILPSENANVTYKDGILKIKGCKPIELSFKPSVLYVNGVACFKRKGYMILYFFKYRDRVVFRLRIDNQRYEGWATVIVDKTGRAYSYEHVEDANDFGLAAQMELVMGGV